MKGLWFKTLNASNRIKFSTKNQAEEGEARQVLLNAPEVDKSFVDKGS
jgi:hypothetical protein